MSIIAFCEWLESTSFGAIARESLYGFQILVAIHIVGIIWSVGLLLWVDLRMLGLGFRAGRLSAIQRSLQPWFLVGFTTMFVSGIALFAGFATSAYGNVYFRIKIAAIVLAGINALTFHWITGRQPSGWDTGGTRPPGAVRAAGLVSLLLWATVVICGRMMSYTLF